MSLYDNELYVDDVKYVAGLDLPWEKLKNRNIMLSGATGLIGSFLIDVILMKNREGLNCMIYALGRSADRMKERFQDKALDDHLLFVPCDVNVPLVMNNVGIVDYVLHLASNTHPMQYSTDPIGTITTNVLGVMNLLEFAVEHKATRFAFASSNEIYGENRGDEELFDENYCGYINCNTMRAGYPESKRCGEALCQAYKAQKGLDVVIMRLTRSYGPTMLMTDTKAINQFIKKGVLGEDVILKSAGMQYYSFQYVADSVAGVLTILLCGENGEAYNIADERGDGMLKDIAAIIAGMNGRRVVYEMPDQIEAAGYSTATKARLDGSKLKALGWNPKYDLKSGLERTIEILRCMK
ncbi:MAG: NAD-dependent epimerase/dehydratase family protein [Lachnospiraceae bacterium]|nr:NAD-dependent epimerase/dehydratase family protein [Lachnospiraceae bacterium]